MNFISTAFSMNMLESPKLGHQFKIFARKVGRATACNFIDVEGPKSVVSNEDLAYVISDDLDRGVLFNRETVKLRGGDTILLCQYSGPRLHTGASEIPAGAQIDYFIIEIG